MGGCKKFFIEKTYLKSQNILERLDKPPLSVCYKKGQHMVKIYWFKLDDRRRF